MTVRIVIHTNNIQKPMSPPWQQAQTSAPVGKKKIIIIKKSRTEVKVRDMRENEGKHLPS